MSSVPKKKKLALSNAHNVTKATLSDFVKEIENKRKVTAESILDFGFNKKRVRVISQVQLVPDYCEGIVYWMSRDCRVQDNWAFLFAQKLALKNEVPLHVCFCLFDKYLDISMRQLHFLIKGLEKVAEECMTLNISFHLLKGTDYNVLTQWVIKHKIGAVVCDFSPLKIPKSCLDEVKSKIKKDVPLVQVDAHNIIPCWITSEKQERTVWGMRNKINSKLDEYLTEFPPVIKHPYTSTFDPKPIDWDGTIETTDADKSVGPIEWASPGYDEAMKTLKNFIETRLKIFASKRNDPTQDALSNLSPWFHFGQISHQRVILCIQKYKSEYKESVDAYFDTAIVRRELAENFCFYNEHYDNINGAYNWAQKSLNEHKDDERTHNYKLEELSAAKTHEDLWNSAQMQLIKEGKMHGFLRLYWAKKILEWTSNPEDALKFAIHLNDRYSIDGRDPNGYTGCMVAICGLLDKCCVDRPVYGRVRYMNCNGCRKKFDVDAFVERYIEIN